MSMRLLFPYRPPMPWGTLWKPGAVMVFTACAASDMPIRLDISRPTSFLPLLLWAFAGYLGWLMFLTCWQARQGKLARLHLVLGPEALHLPGDSFGDPDFCVPYADMQHVFVAIKGERFLVAQVKLHQLRIAESGLASPQAFDALFAALRERVDARAGAAVSSSHGPAVEA